MEVWKCLGERALKFLTKLYNRTMENERMPEEWRDSVLIPIFKNNGDVQSCNNYRGIKLISHTMKLCERIIERRLRSGLTFSNQQYGFMPGKSTTDLIIIIIKLYFRPTWSIKLIQSYVKLHNVHRGYATGKTYNIDRQCFQS